MDTLLGLLGGAGVAVSMLGCWDIGGRLGKRLSRGAGEGTAAAALLVTGGLVLLVNHALVVLGRDAAGNWLLADPLNGRVTVEEEADFAKRFEGEAIGLVP